MSKEHIDYVRHIFDECSYILSVSATLTKMNFLVMIL